MGYQPNTVFLNTLLLGLCINDEVMKAFHFHNDLIMKGFKMNQVSYGVLINGLCKVGEYGAYVRILRQIESQLVTPNAVMYNTSIDGLCEMVVCDALDLYSEMVAKRIELDVVNESKKEVPGSNRRN